jgi:hypothetical protein
MSTSTNITEIIPTGIHAWGQEIEVTKKGVVFTGDAPANIAPAEIIEMIKKLAAVETACAFGVGDLTNFLIGMKGQDLFGIARATGISASDLRRTSITCSRIPYELRDEQLHFDFHAEAAKSRADSPHEWLQLASKEGLDRRSLKRSVELGRLATDEDFERIEEENDGGTRTFGGAVNRISVFNGELERAGYYDQRDPEALYELAHDLEPAVRVWAGIVKRFKGQIPDDLKAEFEAAINDIREVIA